MLRWRLPSRLGSQHLLESAGLGLSCWRYGVKMAGCTGLEPVASGVTGREPDVAASGNSSQPSGMLGNRSARNTDFCPGLGGLFRRRVTPGLQSIRSEEVMWTRLLSVRETASLLRVSTSTVYKLCAEGRLQHVRVSNAIRISEAALRRYG